MLRSRVIQRMLSHCCRMSTGIRQHTPTRPSTRPFAATVGPWVWRHTPGLIRSSTMS